MKVPYKALIVMGSYVDEAGGYDLPNYPVPVLTLNVELDGGLARPGKSATWWRQFTQVEAIHGHQTALTTKPVLVLSHLNHSVSFAGSGDPGDRRAEPAEPLRCRVVPPLQLHASSSSTLIMRDTAILPYCLRK